MVSPETSNVASRRHWSTMPDRPCALSSLQELIDGLIVGQ